jgi:hypothetical protein
MESATVRRRRLALATLALLAVAGFAGGAVVGGGSGGSGTGGSGGDRSGGSPGAARDSTAAGESSAPEEKRPTLAERLTPSQLAGERIVVSIDGTGLTDELRHAIHAGKVAGVVLFEADFPSRAAGRELIDAVQ